MLIFTKNSPLVPKLGLLKTIVRRLSWTAFVYVALGGSAIFADRVIHRPPIFGKAGLPQRIEASIDKPNNFAWAKLYVKRATETIYQVLPMRGSGRFFHGTIPARYMSEQGTNYYIEVTLQKNKRIFFPTAGRGGPKFLRNQTINSRINISIVKPIPGARLKDRKPEIAATVRGIDAIGSREKIKVLVDDVSVPAKVEFGFVTYKFSNALPQGPHELKVQVFDERNTMVAERKSRFYIEAELTPEERIAELEDERDSGEKKKGDAWKTTGSAGVTYQNARTVSDEETPVANPNGYYVIQAQTQSTKGDAAIFVGPISISSLPSEGGSRINQFSAGGRKGAVSGKWGTISSQLSELSASGVSMLGVEGSYDEIGEGQQTTTTTDGDAGSGQASDASGPPPEAQVGGAPDAPSKEEGPKQGWVVKSFSGQTAIPIERKDDPNNLGVYSQHAYGAKVGYQFDPLTGYYSVQSVRVNDDKDSIGTVGLIPYGSNDAASIYTRHVMPEAFTRVATLKQIETEFGINQNTIFTPQVNRVGNTNLSRERTDGHGFYVKLNGEIKNFQTNYNASYSRYSQGFLTRFGGSSSDTESIGGDLSHSFWSGKITLGEGAEFSHDNLEDTKIATTYSRTFNLNLGLNFSPIPNFTFSDSITEQYSEGDPDNELRNVSNNFSAGTNIGWDFWEISQSLSLSFTQTDSYDFSKPESSPGNTTQSYSPNYSLNRNIVSWLSLSMNAGYTLGRSFEHDSDKAATLDHTINDGASLNFTLADGKFTVPLSFTHTRTMDDKTPHEAKSDNFTYTLGLNATLAENHTGNININWSQFRDHINPSADYDQFSLTLGYNAAF